MATTSDVFGDLPEPNRNPCPGCGVDLTCQQCWCQVETGFHHAMPRPGERINICAWTYEDARRAHQDMRKRTGGVQTLFRYVGVAQQMNQLRECRLFMVSGWSRLTDGPMIEQLAKAYRVEMVNYEVQ